MPMIKRQVDFSEFEASQVYKSEFQDSQSCYTEKPCLSKSEITTTKMIEMKV